MKKSKKTPSVPSRNSINPTVLAVVNSIMLAGAASGQTSNANSSTNAPTVLPDVVITGEQEPEAYKPEVLSSPKYTQPLLDVPQTITVVPQEVIEDRGATSLREVLRNVPGISLQAGEGGVPAGDNLAIRGFSARTDLFIDGVRDIGGYSRDPFNLEQVEVVKGPASSYAGRGSTGGHVNLVTKSPQLDQFYNGSLGFGTDEYKRFTADVNQPITAIDGMAFRLNGMWHDADVPGRDVVANKRWGIAPSIAFGLGTPTRATLSYFHLEQDNIPDYGIPWVPDTQRAGLEPFRNQAAPVDFSNFYGLKARDYEKTTTDVITAKVEHDFNDSVSLRNLTRYGINDRDSIITAPRFLNATNTVIRRSDWKSRDQVDDIIANQTDLTVEFSTGKIDHTLVGGVEFARETEENHLRDKTGPDSPATDLFNPNPNDPYTEAIARTGARNKSVGTSASIYAFDTVKLNEQWELNGGLRWDHFDLDYRSYNTNGVLATDLGRTDETLSWRAGVVFKPVPKGSIYAAYGTSFNPAAENLTLSSATDAANNVNLDPEKSRTIELGTKWELFDRRLSLNASIFRTDKSDARTVDPVTSAITPSGDQRVQGFELGVAGSITKDWHVFGGYTYMDSETRASANPTEVGLVLPNTPKHTFAFWTTYELPWNLEVGAGAQYVGERMNNSSTRRFAEDYWLFDAMAAYHVNENFSLRLNVYNLLDEDYIDLVGGGHFVPGAGRFAMLTANFSF